MGEPIIIWPPDGFSYEDSCRYALGQGWYGCPASFQEWAQEEYGGGAYACCPI